METPRQASAGDQSTAEAIRLVIWDLDETFWHGTLTEGGIRYRPELHDTVIALARRGIISSICSRNDPGPVREVLEAQGIWPYFVFASIAWSPKGPRIDGLIKAAQLRAPTVLFIDDNPLNLQEALHFVPGLQIAGPECLAGLLGDPRLQGRDDPHLTRLDHYRLLEQRQAAQRQAGTSTRDFLRASDIRIRVLPDIAPHIDRVIELINRTNQLNFTKWRLQDDPDLARANLLRLTREFRYQSALVQVSDRYGDHGLCGFYMVETVTNRLVHFCFSCRIQDMGVERWLYDRLGRPQLTVVGEVSTDLFAGDPPDWIGLDSADGLSSVSARGQVLGRVFVRGGCDLQLVAHYLSLHGSFLQGEYQTTRFGKTIRLDHSACLRLALDGLTEPGLRALERIGYRQEDFVTVLSAQEHFDTYLFSFQSDAVQALYRHRSLGFAVPFGVPQISNMLDLATFGANFLAHRLPDSRAQAALAALLEDYAFIGPIDRPTFTDNLLTLLAATPRGARIFIILGNELHPDGGRHPYHHKINSWISETVGEAPQDIHLLPMRDFIEDTTDLIDINHFAPPVYRRLADALIHRAEESGMVRA